PPIRSITHAAPAAGKARTLPLIFSGAESKVGTIKVRDTRAQFAPMPAKFRGLLCVAAVLAALGPMSAQAFTLIQGTAKIYVNPKAGYTTSLVQVRGTFTIAASCTGVPLNFVFQFDAKPLWSKSISGCTATTWDTGWSPYNKPPVTPSV